MAITTISKGLLALVAGFSVNTLAMGVAQASDSPQEPSVVLVPDEAKLERQAQIADLLRNAARLHMHMSAEAAENMLDENPELAVQIMNAKVDDGGQRILANAGTAKFEVLGDQQIFSQITPFASSGYASIYAHANTGTGPEGILSYRSTGIFGGSSGGYFRNLDGGVIAHAAESSSLGSNWGLYGNASVSGATNYGVYGVTSATNSYGIYGSATAADSQAGYFDGPVGQAGSYGGVVKAAIFTDCGLGTIYRYFTPQNVTPTNTTLSAGKCSIDFGFDISQRFWQASAVFSAEGRGVNCDLGGTNSTLTCFRYTIANPTAGWAGSIMVTIY